MSQESAAGSIHDAFNAAFDSETPEETPLEQETKTAVEPEQAADAVPEPREEDDLNLTAEDLAAIKANPLLTKVHKNMLRGFTQKTQGLAEERKLIESQKQVLEWLEQDPKGAATALARTVGLELREAKTPTEKVSVMQRLEALVGPEGARELAPILKEMNQEELAPLQNTVKQFQEFIKAEGERRNLAEAESAATEFRQLVKERGDDLTPAMEQELAQTVLKMVKAGFKPGTMTRVELLDLVFAKIAAKNAKTNAAKVQAERIREAVADAEPVRGIRTTRDTETGVDPGKKSFSENFSAAWDESVRETRRR